MQKSDTLADGKVSSHNKQPVFKCGDCLHFNAHALRSKDQVCSKLGVRSVAKAPPCFTPDVTQVAQTSDQLAQLTSIFHSLNSRQRRILIAMMTAPERKKQQFVFGTKVYFRAVGRDYLSNYLSGYCMGYTRDGELMVCGDPDNTTVGSSYVAVFTEDDSVFTVAKFQEHRAMLVSRALLQDPEKPLLKFKPQQVLDNYEPPSLDSAPRHWHTKEKLKKKKAKKADITIR